MMRFFLPLLCSLPFFFPISSAAAPIIISEFMASDSPGFTDEDGEASDWIELHNRSEAAIDLSQWSLTDNQAQPGKWRLPATNIAAGGFVVVFASGKDRSTPGAPLHTNFRLSADGEYLALIEPDGRTIASEFSPAFPPQRAEVSFGWGSDLTSTLLLTTNALGRYRVPADGTLDSTWTLPAFDDSAWTAATNGLGYDSGTPGTIAGHFRTDVRATMREINSSIYFRMPFLVSNITAVTALTLKMKYKDGFVVFLNGAELTAANAPSALTWSSSATSARPNPLAVTGEEFDVSDGREFLREGTNWLAIHGLSYGVTNLDFLLTAALEVTHTGGLTSKPRYFTVPTPGGPNSAGTEDLGPIVEAVDFAPALPVQPLDNEDLTITARVSPAFGPVTNVTLHYRVMYEALRSVSMVGDPSSPEGIYRGIVPADVATPGQMIRFYVTARDNLGRLSRWPLFESAGNSPEYLGTVVANPNVTSELPIWEWFAQNVANARNRTGTRGSVFFRGEFYDNVRIRERGGFTALGSQKFDFNTGFHCRINDEVGRVEEANLNGNGFDPTYIRPAIAFEMFRTAGNPASAAFPLLMRVNGQPDRIGNFIEQVDERFLDRWGFDRRGALYKFVQRAQLTPGFYDSTDGLEKKTRVEEDRSDLQAVVSGIATNLPVSQRGDFLFDHFNIPNLINYLAIECVIRDDDNCRKNFYFYRDTLGTGEWYFFPWDKDITLGLIADGMPNLPHPLFGSYAFRKFNPDQWNICWDTVFRDPRTREMYLRRVRTLMDEQLQLVPGHLESRANHWFDPVFPHLGPAVSNQVIALKAFFPIRRGELYAKYASTNSIATNALIPSWPILNAGIRISSIEASPVSGRQSEEYLCITNEAPFAVDLSGWRLEGAIEYTFKPGTVMPATSVMYVSPDLSAFRARATGPRAGQGLFVQGNYRGQLSARGERVRLVDAFGQERHGITSPADPSPAQEFLRITEIMYHPSAFVSQPEDGEGYEFIELKNIGPEALNLSGVQFGNGIDFRFSGQAVTNLPAGARIVVVKNRAQFVARYGEADSIAGVYNGSLNNSGERLQLLDDRGEEILDFTFADDWYPITDGSGFSLVIVDETAGPETWNHKEQWRPSTRIGGSPSDADPAPHSSPLVMINEVLAHSATPPLVDSIELYNAEANPADISGWYLSDDFNSPQKFRIPAGTVIPPHGYRTFTETDFNSGPTAFALSANGDEVYLFAADGSGALSGYHHGFTFGATENGVSIGRHVTSTGEEQVVRQSAITPTAPNAGPRVGPVVISEILYRPLATMPSGESEGEFIELLNISTAPVALFEPAAAQHRWALTGGITFTFPDYWLGPGKTLLVVDFDPETDDALLEAFRARHGIPSETMILGPYSGRLRNEGEIIRLQKPQLFPENVVAPVTLEEVHYSAAAPWEPAANGFGLSLHRAPLTAYANDPASWRAAPPTPGSVTAHENPAPIITTQPASQTTIVSQDARFSVSAQGSGRLRYQWRHNDVILSGETNAVLWLRNLEPRDAGSYRIAIFNEAGSVVSAPAILTLLYGATVLQPPEGVRVRLPTNNVHFRVSAYSPHPIRYQWQLNGADIPQATNTTLTVTNVSLSDQGEYTVLITDAVGTARSAPAALVILIDPVIVVQPLSQPATVGGNVTFSVTVTNTATLPIGYRWRRQGITAAYQVSYDRTGFFTATNVQPGQTNFTVVVTNLSQTSGLLSSSAIVILLMDADRDGLPDTWETEHQFDPNDPSDAQTDADGDGMSNQEEYLAATNPTDPASHLRIDVLQSPSGPTLIFEAKSNRTYTIQTRNHLDDVAPEGWFNLMSFTARATNRGAIMIDPGLTTNRFYRLTTPHQP